MGGNPPKRKYTQFGHLNFLLDISTWTIEHGGVLLSTLDLMTDLGFDNGSEFCGMKISCML